MWIDRMLDPHCDFELWPHPWPWPLIFKVKFWKCCISGMGGPIDMEHLVDRMLDPHSDFKLWPHPWPWTLIFKVKFWRCYISGMGGLIYMEWKGCESIGCIMTLNCVQWPHPWHWPLNFKVKFWKSCDSAMDCKWLHPIVTTFSTLCLV